MVKMYPFHDSERKVEFNISKIIRKYAVDMERVTKSVERPVYQEQIQFCGKKGDLNCANIEIESEF